MGVLEDAIREHLELKRKHGASDEEVERNELEALGPARREFEASGDEVSEEEPPEAGLEPAEPELEHHADAQPEPLEEPAAEQPTPEPGFVEPGMPEAATRIHESPVVQPRLAEDDARDFGADDDDEDEDEDEQAAGRK